MKVLTTSETEARYRRMFAAHHRAIHTYFRRRIDREVATDCTAETFLIAWRRIADAPAPEGELRWLYTIARNVLRNAYRAKRRSRTVTGIDIEPVDRGESPEAAIERREEAAAVRRAVDRLRSSDREILTMAMWDEIPREDIAAIVGCSPHAVSQRIHRAATRLAKELERDPVTRTVGVRRGEATT